MAQKNTSSMVQADAAEVALTLSKRLIAILKVKKVMNVEAGLEMIALALTISSEVCRCSLQPILFIYLNLELWGIPGIGQSGGRCFTEVRVWLISIGSSLTSIEESGRIDWMMSSLHNCHWRSSWCTNT
jgi:hypothetical protein